MTEIMTIFIAAHKPVVFPKDELYTPIHVGAANAGAPVPLAISDATGEHLSTKNPYYNELTAVYWAWKNCNADIVGLVHYRRFFTLTGKKKLDAILTEDQLKERLMTCDILVPTKRRYWIESNVSHYCHAHHREPLDILREVIAEQQPTALAAFDVVMKRTWAHMFNMFIMRQPYFEQYCAWLFPLLAKVEERIQADIVHWTPYEQRVYGFLSELLLDVWLEAHHYDYHELPFVFMERQNWLMKGGRFIARKLGFCRQQ